jgi:hypothetical protein
MEEDEEVGEQEDVSMVDEDETAKSLTRKNEVGYVVIMLFIFIKLTCFNLQSYYTD